MRLGGEEVKWRKGEVVWKGERPKEKVLTRFFSQAARKMPGNPEKKVEVGRSREVGGRELIRHA